MAVRNRTSKKARQKSVAQAKREAAQDRFLAVFAECGCVSRAVEAAGVGRQTHYDWIDADEGYRARFEDAKEVAVDALEFEARRRAVDGVQEPVGWYKGVAGGTVTRYSDTLLIFLLKGWRPGRYRDRVELSGNVAVPVSAAIAERLGVGGGEE